MDTNNIMKVTVKKNDKSRLLLSEETFDNDKISMQGSNCEGR